MARTNGPIQVWSRTDTTPTDVEGGYAGGDSTAAAVGTSLDQSSRALGTVDNLAVTASTLDYGQEASATISGASPWKTIHIGIPKGMPDSVGQQLTADAAASATSSANSAAASDDSRILAQQAQAASLEIPDDNTAALIGNPATLTVAALQEREAWANVIDYGGVGDGTVDDTSAIQAAIDAIEPTGGTVFIPAGRWLYTSDLTLYSGVILRGAGQRLWTTGSTATDRQVGTMLVPGADAARIRIEGVTGMAGHLESVQVHDLTIDGATTTHVGISVVNAYDITLSNVYIRAVQTGITCQTLSTSDYVENLRLRDVKITNGTVAVDSTGSASKGFIDSTGLHVRNMSQAAVRGAWTGIFAGGFIGRIGTAATNDGVAFDLVDADGVVITGVPFENVPTPVRVSGQSYGVTVSGCVTNSSSTDFGLVRGVDLQDCDGWAVVGNKFLFTNATSTAVAIYGTTQARYGAANGNVFQGSITGSQQRAQIGNPGVNAVNVDGRWQRVDADALYVGSGTGATSSGIGGAAGATRALDYYTGQAGVTSGRRWAARVSAGAESGGDNGSDYELVSYNDSGAGTSVRARVRRSDGRFTVFGGLQLAIYTTANRPDPSIGQGVAIFDSTLGKPIVSTGAAWVDFTGSAA